MTADNHLGRHYDRMFSHRLEERRAWLRAGFARAVEYALEQRAHFFLQAGDLFDIPEPRNLERQFVAEALARLRDAGVRCLAIGGNHDTPRARNSRATATPQATYARLGGLRLLGDRSTYPASDGIGAQGEERGEALTLTLSRGEREPIHPIDSEAFDVDGLRVAIGGMTPDLTQPAGSDPLEGVVWGPEADIALLMLHGSLEGHVYPGAPEPILRRRTVEALEGVDCLVVGHVHGFAAFSWGDKMVLVPGATERMTFGESRGRAGFAYLEMEPGRVVDVRHVPVETQPRLQTEVHTSEFAEGDPAEILMARLEELCDPAAMVRIALKGPISRHHYHGLKLRELSTFGASRSFFFDLDTTGLRVEDEQRVGIAPGARLSQREELIRFAREGWKAATEEERSLIEEALQAVLDEYQ